MRKAHRAILLAFLFLIVWSFLLQLVGCSSNPGTMPATTTNSSPSLVLTSSAFATGGRIPVKYTQQGDNVSPPLTWNMMPTGTQSFALITEDIDGPSGIITHWIVYNIPNTSREMAEGTPVQDRLANGALQGNNIRGTRGYVGPAPPAGTTHRYEFTLFALDQTLSLGPGAARADFIQAIQGHILGTGQTMGLYQRQ
jgi:Raf kinase inhibitor-like YbhB/YbcL family protein